MRYATVRFLNCTFWILILTFPIAAQVGTAPAVVTYGAFETRDYWSENGRRIRVTSLGNLVGLESPHGFEHIDDGRRAREGYVLGYTDTARGLGRVIFDVHDIHSNVLGIRDFVPYSFTGPAAGTVFPVSALVSSTIVVDTADGLLRLTHQIDWQAGLGTVAVTTTITNRSTMPIAIAAFKRHAIVGLDEGGIYGAATANNVIRVVDGFTSSISCYCAPYPGPPPLTPQSVSQHVMQVLGIPSPSYKMIHTGADNSELFSAGAATSSDLPGARTGENDQLTLVWSGSILPPGGFRKFAVQYQQQ